MQAIPEGAAVDPVSEPPRVPARGAPRVANGRRLVTDVRNLLNDTIRPMQSNLIATTYGTASLTNPTSRSFVKPVGHPVVASPTASAVTLPLNEEQRAQSIAHDLILDINLYFEERLQFAMEEDPHFVDTARDARHLIHEKIDFGYNDQLYDETGRLNNHQQKIIESYKKSRLTMLVQPAALHAFWANERRYEDAAIRELKKHVVTGRSPEETESFQEEVTAQLDGLKNLNALGPYFAGSVDYNEGQDNTLGYHAFALGVLPKEYVRRHPPEYKFRRPYKDYTTLFAALLPFLNPRNLGAGVTEGTWKQMPPEFREEIEAGMKAFVANLDEERKRPVELNREGRPLLPSLVETYDRIVQQAQRSLDVEIQLNEVVPEGEENGPSLERFWNSAIEDQRKAAYTDMAQATWSWDHLLGGGGGFAQDYDPDKALSGKTRSRLPRRSSFRSSQELDMSESNPLSRRGTGLSQRSSTELSRSSSTSSLPEVGISRQGTDLSQMDDRGLPHVTGVAANYLETPEVAAKKYWDETLKHATPEILLKWKTEFPESYPKAISLLEEFKEKHTRWWHNALRNHLPIIGGISGHTLAYMNLYGEALGEVPVEERHKYPTMEAFRGFLVAELSGNHKHHSVDEVLTASTAPAFVPREERLRYRDMQGYGDLFHSTDEQIRTAAQTGKKEVIQYYVRLPSNSVLSELRKNLDGPAESRVRGAIVAYGHSLGSMDMAMITAAKSDIVTTVQQGLVASQAQASTAGQPAQVPPPAPPAAAPSAINWDAVATGAGVVTTIAGVLMEGLGTGLAKGAAKVGLQYAGAAAIGLGGLATATAGYSLFKRRPAPPVEDIEMGTMAGANAA